MYELKKPGPIWILLSLQVLTGCNYSAGFKKGFGNGPSFSYEGLAVKNVLLVGPGNAVLDNNQVRLNSRIALVAAGVTNYELKDGKAFPGMMLSVTDKNGLAVMSYADLFPDTVGYPPLDASELRANITVANPIVAGQTYHVKMRVWDKVKPDHEVNAETDLVVQ